MSSFEPLGPGQNVAVDLVIPVHNATRPIGRAVASVALGGLELNGPGGVRVSVVCHNVPITEIAPGIDEDLRRQVRYLQFNDGVPSPAGPRNYGLTQTDAPFASVMDSDDTLEQGALQDWLDVANSHGSAAVIPPERHDDGRKVRTPVHRLGRTKNLHPVKDRLMYRTAPFGLISTAEIRRLGLRFSEGLPTGEDQEFSAKLWFGGGRIDYAAGAGCYVVGADAGDRVTHARRPVPDELGFALRLVASEWFTQRSLTERRAIATKLIRVHIFSLVQTRHDSGGWSRKDLVQLANAVTEILRAADGAADPLSRADRRLLEAILLENAEESQLIELARARRRFGAYDTIVPQNLKAVLNPESPLRFMPAAALMR